MREFEPIINIRKVAIVGAGPAGLTAALALRHVGLEVEVYEQAREFSRVGAGIQLSPNATAVLEPLGVLPRLLEVGVQPTISRSFEWETGQQIQETAIGGATYGTPYVQLHRADLHAVLAEGLPSSVFKLDRKLVGLVQGEDGVTLEFEGGESAMADIVVGADGIHSTVREICFPPRQLRFSGWASHRGILPASDVEDLGIEVINAKWMASDKRDVIHYYISNEKEVTFIAKMPQKEASVESWSRQSDKSELLDALVGLHPTIKELVSRCERIGKWAIYDREPLYTWSKGRVTLVGDAAHPMRPWIGQGGVAAIEDGAVLARSLMELHSDARLIDAWELYEWNRKPRVAWMQALSSSHEFRRPFDGSPHPSRYLYAYNAWKDELIRPNGVAPIAAPA